MLKTIRIPAIFVLLVILSLPAFADDGFEITTSAPENMIIDDTGADSNVSFWEVPLAIQIAYLTGTILTAYLFFKIIPFIWGKIQNYNIKKKQLYQYIAENPGSSIAKISREQNIERSTLKYYLYLLESESKIIFSKLGKFTGVFQNHKYTEKEKVVIQYLQNESDANLLLLIISNPGMTNKEISDRLNMRKNAISWHISRLLDDGIIRYERSGVNKKYYVYDDIQKIITSYKNS